MISASCFTTVVLWVFIVSMLLLIGFGIALVVGGLIRMMGE